MKRELGASYLGKYREIIIAVAFFLVFDLAVLVLNFYVSFQIAEDALAINLAGRQRMLSQRMTKELLIAQSDAARGLTPTEALRQLRDTAALFDGTLTAFRSGGAATGGDGKPVVLSAQRTASARGILDQAVRIWAPYQMLLEPLVDGDAPITGELELAVAYARRHNLELLKLMNGLTSELEKTAHAKADTLRRVQTVGIILAMFNFAFILLKFLRRLRTYDRRIEAAQRETAEILDTVKEGLFLLDAHFRIGSQYSASLSQILGRDIQAGADFRAVLGSMLTPQTLGPACDYITLLLGDRVKESLVSALNPLTAVEVSVGHARRYLTLMFNRVLQDGRISHLLVTVTDVTAQVELEHALADSRQRAQIEVDAMFNLLRVEPATLRQFLAEAERSLLDINDRLRSVKAQHDYRTTIAAIFRKVHTLKGEAATLGLGMFEELAQRFEELLAGLRDKGAVSGEDLIGLPLPLDEFLQRIALVRELLQKLADYHNAYTPASAQAEFDRQLGALAERIAQDQGKCVRLVTELELMGSLPQQVFGELRDIAVQLLRNAVVHGIEAAGERSSLSKPDAGTIYLGLKPLGEGEYEFVLRDDGRGLVPQRVRQALVQSGRYTRAQLDELDDRQVVMKIFDAGYTTAGQVTRDAGHGVGLDVVRQKIRQLGAQLRIRSAADAYTQFSIRFAA